MATTARRLSTAPAARLSRLWRSPPPIAELPEMKALLAVQRIAERVPESPAPSLLLQDAAFRQWVDSFRSSRGIADAAALVDKEAFDALFKGAEAQIKAKEDAVLQGKAPIEALEEEQLTQPEALEYVEAVKLKLARHMCAQAGNAFELLDKDKDGKVLAAEVERLLRVVEQGNTPEWLRSQFELYDANSDNAVNEDESKQILDSMISVQKTVLTELFVAHVANMPKKHMKLIAKGINEEDWKSKIPEKVRCIYHFADKVEDEAEIQQPKQTTGKTVHWDAFLESQEAELPELYNMVGVYAKGIHDYRQEFYERQREKRSTRIKGLALAVAIGVGDFIATIV